MESEFWTDELVRICIRHVVAVVRGWIGPGAEVSGVFSSQRHNPKRRPNAVRRVSRSLWLHTGAFCSFIPTGSRTLVGDVVDLRDLSLCRTAAGTN
jgi:hypothetical protein